MLIRKRLNEVTPRSRALLETMLSQTNSDRIHTSHIFKNDFHFVHFLFGFPNKILYALPTSPMRATSSTHLILSDLIILIICDDMYELCISYYVIFFILLLLTLISA
jgi:hypothetical protein